MSWTAAPLLMGRHVTLRPMVADDRDALLDAARDGRAWELFYTNAPGPETIDGWIDKALAQQSYGRALPFVVLVGERLVGATRFMRMSPENRRLEIGGTFYAASVRRSGVNSEAKLLLLTEAFEAMACDCVQIRTDAFNRASQAAIERLGAKRDGILRNHIVMRDGRLRDTIVYSILANEWAGVKTNLLYQMSRHEGQGA